MEANPATVTLRPVSPGDEGAVARVAQLDSSPLPPAPRLVAERDGVIEAAISLQTGELVSNPFVPTVRLCELLRLHAAAAHSASASRRRRLRPRIAAVPA
jgi:hypothetical protein